MASLCFVTFVIYHFVSFNIVKGDSEVWRMKVIKGDKGECSAKFQVETIEGACKHKEPCLQGPPGPIGYTGPKGDKGERGERGERGENGKCGETGTEANPATSCVDSDIKDNPYIFPPSPFKVNCDYASNKICFNKTKKSIEIDKVSNTTKKEPYWLWSDADKEYLFNFYGLKKSQISHLISISDRVTQELIFHCNNLELKNNIQILLWDNTLVGQTATSLTPATYTVPEDLNGCQNLLDPNEWRTAIITLDTWSGAAKNFFIPAKTLDVQGYYIQFQNICFYF